MFAGTSGKLSGISRRRFEIALPDAVLMGDSDAIIPAMFNDGEILGKQS
jgi:hypothetical protein